jgi:hypothetical protein
MLRCEVAVIPIPDNLSRKVTVLAGAGNSISNSPVEIFNEIRIDFLAELSRRLLADSVAKSLPDVATFAFWCRRGHLMQMLLSYTKEERLRMGLGLTFHICPANVPVNFAFSMAFGLLSGNTCVLRLPSKASVSADVLVKVIGTQLEQSQFHPLRDALSLIHYERDDEISRFWMSVSDGRVVWGGDETVAYMRAFPSKSRSREVAFSDRYSLCTLEPKSILRMEEPALKKFCGDLFNDIYLMDQAACSSPQLIAWIGKKEDVQSAQAKLWPVVVKIAEQKYSIQAVHVMDKFVQSCRSAVSGPHVEAIERSGNVLYRIALSQLNQHQDECRGYFGTIHEVVLPSLDALAPIVNERYQTLTNQGIDNSEVRGWIVRNQLRGIDRVVPVGHALDMNIVWDGHDMVNSLSRIIDFRSTRKKNE